MKRPHPSAYDYLIASATISDENAAEILAKHPTALSPY